MNFEKIILTGNWSLFLDRDGVINRHIQDGYILEPGQFELIGGVAEAIPILSGYFTHIFIVTNQQCVGKGLATMKDIEIIHNHMKLLIDPEGLYLSGIFVSPYLASEQNEYRKPGIGMARKAVELYSDVELTRSVMAGDSETDMIFGRSAGMMNVLIGDKRLRDESLYDREFYSLYEFAMKIASESREH